jgi:spermidine synthase
MPPVLAGIIVFGASAAVLVLEILAVRLLAPFMGITLETTTAVIGTVLAGISIGTWLGGRAADRAEPRRLLGLVLIVGGVLALLIIPLINVAASLGFRPDAAGVVAVTAIVFFAPAAVLSAASPIVVKLQLRSLGETGSVVGRLSAIGTAGAILGTFVTGFVLVAALPTRPIVIGVGVVLIVAGVAISAMLGRSRGPWIALLAVVAGGLALAWTTTAPERCERESAYFCINVHVDAGYDQGRELRMDTLRHAYIDLADPTWLEFSYTRLFGDVIDGFEPPDEPIDALHIGGGGFTMPRYIAATRPGSFSRVLELDAVVLQTAREELGLETSDDLQVLVGDARVSLEAEPTDGYDIVVGDAFAGPAVPWHLTTREFIGEIARVLRPDGIYVANVIDYPPLALARAELATMRDVFEHVAFIGPGSRIDGTSGGNLILMASDSPFPVDDILAANAASEGSDELVTDPAVLDAWIDGAPVLTDDYAPTDQLLSRFG